MNKFQAFEILKEYSNNLKNIPYEEIYSLLKNGIKQIPIPLAKIKKGAYIDRVRKNNGNSLFNSIDELGYIKNQEIIEKYLTSFGRANCPHQVLFYGAVETSQIDKQRLTAIAETSSLFRIPNQNCIDGEYYTVSRWETLEEFLVVEVVFSEFALANNKDIQTSYEKQKEFLNNKGLQDEEIQFHLDFLKFISEQFSKKVDDPDDYKISVAYTNIALLHPDVKGISYPSVQTEYFGVNLVLTPNTVDDFLKPIICSTQKIYKNGLNTLIANGEHYCDNIDVNKEIEWKENDKSLITDYEEVKKHLKL